MICPPLPPSPMVANWLRRHASPVSFALHLVGIPISIVGLLIAPIAWPLLSLRLTLLAITLFAGGYALQFLGHALEGTDPGEIILIKRRLGLPYVEFASRRQPSRKPA